MILSTVTGITTGTAKQLLTTTASGEENQVLVNCVSGTGGMMIGDSTVTTTVGIPVAVGATITLTVFPNDTIYAIGVSNTCVANVLHNGV